MNESRLGKRREASKQLLKRVYCMVAIFTTIVGLVLAYYYSVILFVVLSAVVFFGIIALNCFNIRKLIPGMAFKSWVFKLGIGLLYTVAVFMLISKVVVLHGHR